MAARVGAATAVIEDIDHHTSVAPSHVDAYVRGIGVLDHVGEMMATGWQDAVGASSSAYLAAFDAVRRITEDVFFAAFLSLGLYLATLSAAILTTRLFARWVGVGAGAASALLLAGNVISMWSDPAFLLVLLGFAVFLVVVVALGLSMWRGASARTPAEESARSMQGVERTR